MNNVVGKEKLREIQANVLAELRSILEMSFGPMGSNSIIKKENQFNIYTKDGHTILKNIYFHGIIEQAIKDDIETITRHIVKTVGDGTTSAVLLSDMIFDLYNNIEGDYTFSPVEIMEFFSAIVDEISKCIREYGHPCTLDDIYDIAMISTNGNEFVSSTIRDIYKDYGMEVFIDVLAAIDEKTTIKSYDGMTIDTGINDSSYVTNVSSNEAVIDHPRIYFFKDPIDTSEMAVMLDAIISKNIVTPLNSRKTDEIIPTIIVAPKISRDLSSLLNKITGLMSNMEPGSRIPFMVITDYHQEYEIEDISYLCGEHPPIHKYIDADIMKHDIEQGLCPTPDTIQDFCGTCERVVSSSYKTSFINPSLMYDNTQEDGYSVRYKNLLTYLDTELSRARQDGEDMKFIGTLKRRIHALKSNLVEIAVGGISATDRDAIRDLVEDAVLNCRSASMNGVGYGANFMGYMASREVAQKWLEMYRDTSDIAEKDAKYEIAKGIYDSFRQIIDTLYAGNTDVFDHSQPLNIRTGEWDGTVKSSIESDIIVLQTVVKIVGLMATSNQFIVPSPMHNVYIDD